MTESDSSSGAFTGVGRWLAVASELPCSVVIFLFAGQLIGQQIWGPGGAIAGALIGVILGFLFGIYSVYITIKRFEQLEIESRAHSRVYMPPEDEIFEEYDWSSKKTES
jgi:hypothetical protein